MLASAQGTECGQNLNKQMATMSPKQKLLCTEIFMPWCCGLPLALLTSSQMWDFTHTLYSWLYQHTPYPSDWIFPCFRGEIGKTTFCLKGVATYF